MNEYAVGVYQQETLAGLVTLGNVANIAGFLEFIQETSAAAVYRGIFLFACGDFVRHGRQIVWYL